ncbi:hypothetical protein D3C78_1356940 [compost metagenome]
MRISPEPEAIVEALWAMVCMVVCSLATTLLKSARSFSMLGTKLLSRRCTRSPSASARRASASTLMALMRGVTSVANFTTFTTLPASSSTGL